MATHRLFGVDYHCEDWKATEPTLATFEDSETIFQWFQANIPLESTVHVRILCVRVDNPTSTTGEFSMIRTLPVLGSDDDGVLPFEVWDLACSPAGGAAGLTDEPWRFILQSPQDGGPFFSLAASRSRHVVKAVFFFDSDSFDPLAMQGGEASLVSSRSHGLQLVTLPHKLLQIHSTSISRQLARIIGRVRDVETRLERADEASSDLGAISRALHSCTAELVYLERRSRFEQSIVEAIDTIVAKSRLYTGPWPAMAPQRNALSSRNFEFESLPRRIENARATINTLIQQRNEQISIELTQASFRIAAATLSDARSMKTIAILTMVLLPATTVASIFSMNLFDWFAVKGDRIASKWLWIYWVVTIPLTALILLAWWVWNRQGDRHVHQIVRSAEDGNASRIEDIDGLGLRSVGSMQTLSARTKRD